MIILFANLIHSVLQRVVSMENAHLATMEIKDHTAIVLDVRLILIVFLVLV